MQIQTSRNGKVQVGRGDRTLTGARFRINFPLIPKRSNAIKTIKTCVFLYQYHEQNDSENQVMRTPTAQKNSLYSMKNKAVQKQANVF